MENLTVRIVRARCAEQTGIMWLYNTRESQTKNRDEKTLELTPPTAAAAHHDLSQQRANNTPNMLKEKCGRAGHTPELW